MNTVSHFERVKRALANQHRKSVALRRRAARLGSRRVGRFADLSSNNGPISAAKFEHYAQTADLVAIKVTEGTGYVNPYAAAQVKAAKAAGLIVMPYHFARPDADPTLAGARKEAKHFVAACRSVGLHMGPRRKFWFQRDELPGCLDYETAHLEGKDRKWEASFTRCYRGLAKHGITTWDRHKASATEGPILYGGSVVRERFGVASLRRLYWLAAYVTDPTPYWPTCVPKRLRFAWQETDSAQLGLGTTDASKCFCSVGGLVRLAI